MNSRFHLNPSSFVPRFVPRRQFCCPSARGAETGCLAGQWEHLKIFALCCVVATLRCPAKNNSPTIDSYALRALGERIDAILTADNFSVA